MPAIIGL